ncbi:GntR family transcriptional regulator [Roseovarius tibetensis]|uniref:GntR family transcriptional regulator n=1 Tax=Roseovarius tibetensis TaxID=2685897 RepID=UPI003D7FDA83
MTTPYDFQVQRDSSTLRQGVTESIRKAIAVGHYKAGDRMPEKQLCELTGVSRTLVREALRQLESERLVEVIAHKGPIVAQMTAEEAKGVYEVREVLESLAARLFARNATPRQFTDLEAAFAEVRTSYKVGDVLERLSAKNHFYDCLVKGSGNAALGQTLHMINARAMILRGRSLSHPERSKTSLKEIEAIISALRDRDADKAADMAVHHVQMAAQVALASFEE